MKDSMKKDARVCLIPDYMETHTITTYRLASDKFLRTYFPESAYGLTIHEVQKEKALMICSELKKANLSICL